MKITIRHPAGLEIQFEGEVSEFDRFTGFLTDLPAFVGTLGPTATLPLEANGSSESGSTGGGIDARSVLDKLQAVGATTDIERVTVMAVMAHDAGLPGIDYATVERLYVELGMPKPATLRATFSNAKQKGYVRSVGSGAWAPTVNGENFARHGLRGARPRARRVGTALDTGGDG